MNIDVHLQKKSLVPKENNKTIKATTASIGIKYL